MKVSDNFDGVIEFVAVAEQQGFSSAAKKLACSTSHISRQINNLEQKLGVALVARTTRTVSLTQAGEKYFHKCRDLVNGLQQANEELGTKQFQLSGVLRVSAAGTFAESYAGPALIEFAKRHPQLNLQIIFDSRLINFVDEGFDFAIRMGKLKDSGLIARPLVKRSLVAVASPDYINTFGMPNKIEDLKHHKCITNNDIWNFEENKQVKPIRVNSSFQSNNAQIMVEACLKGLGICYMPKSNFAPYILSKELIPVLAPYWYTGLSSWIVYQNRQYLPMRAKLAIDYLIEHFANWTEA
jgi:DNA-binding transcriptional LysR family regulator